MKVKQFFVGLGASAGGLEALSSFFSMMPSNTGATFIVVQHLSPDFKSLMDELLSKYTKMPIKVATNDLPTKPDTIYLIPPRTNLTIINGHLYLEEYKDNKGLHLPIDIFFESLALDQKERAIAVVLSGTGSDGSRGIVRINEQGGMVLSQTVESSRFDGMPQNAISTGICDFILRPEDMAREIINYMNHPSVIPGIERVQESFEMQQLKRIGIIMNVYSGIDFNMYKSSTILRRVERRIKVNKFATIDEYIQYLLQSDKEKEILKKDFLIGVTGFFRDNGAYDALVEKAFSYFDDSVRELRIWVAGCSTGEEAYSIAIRLQEYIDSLNRECSFKLFATDINSDAIEVANIGFYNKSVIESIPDDVVRKYFDTYNNGYRISEKIRTSIVFAKHNLLLDPPFSKLDLLVCRNVLIYIKPEFQESILRQFYRSLNENGVLFLGSSESLGILGDAFHTIDKKWNVFRKNLALQSRIINNTNYQTSYRYREPNLHDTINMRTAHTSRESILTTMIGAIIDAGIVIDDQDKIIQVINDCSNYIQPQPGRFTSTLGSNIKKEYLLIINNIIRRLKNKDDTVVYNNVRQKDSDLVVNIQGYLIRTREEKYFLISFKEVEVEKNQGVETIENIDYTKEKNDRIDFLEKELMNARENLQATVEELETSNEELQSSNEELIASNEELQSTNEELQSVNEELYSVNNEYQSKIEALTELNNDLTNLLINTEVGAIYLDRKLRIRKITPLIPTITNVVDDDVNRPFSHISVMDGYSTIFDDVQHVSDTLKGIEKDVIDKNGKSWLCKIKPYRKEQNVVDGVIITFVEITNFVNELVKNRIANNILGVVLQQANMGWFRYDIFEDEFTVSPSFFNELGFKDRSIPLTLSDFYKNIEEKDRTIVQQKFRILINNKETKFDEIIELRLPSKSTVKMRYTGERLSDAILGTFFIIADSGDNNE